MYFLDKRYRQILSILLASGLFLSASGCAKPDKDAAEKTGASENKAPEKESNIEVLQLRPRQFVSKLELTGSAEPWKSVTVASEMAGKLEYLGLVEGQTVKQGQLVARVNARLLSAQKEQAAANYRLSQVQDKWQKTSQARQINLAESNYDLSATNYSRQENLYNQQVVSAQNFDSAQNNLDNAKVQLDLQKISLQSIREVNQQSMKVAGASLQVARENLSKAVMTSPLTGYVNRVYVDAGEVINPGAPMADIIQTQLIKVVVGVPERDISSVRMGQQVKVRFDAIPNEEFIGSVIFIAASADQESRTFPIKLRLDNPGLKVRGGMIGRAIFERDSESEVLVVPQETVMDTKAGRYVFIEKEGRAVRRDVILGKSQGASVVIRSGLKTGEKLVVTGHRTLRNGDKVDVLAHHYQGAKESPQDTNTVVDPKAQTETQDKLKSAETVDGKGTH